METTLAEAKRSEFVDEDARKGYEFERRLNHHLLDTPCEFHWNNEHGHSVKVDFDLYFPTRYIEAEWKDAKSEHLALRYGFDFLAAKVHKYIEWDAPVYYAIGLSHFRYYVVGTVVEIMLWGVPKHKETTRGWEWFYRVPLSKLSGVRL